MATTTTRTTGTLTVEIKTTCLDVSHSLDIEIDKILNKDKDGNVQSCFVPNENIYLRIYPSPEDLDYLITTSNGTISRRNDLDRYPLFQEELTFENKKATVTYPIHEIVSAEWEGFEPCNITGIQYQQGYKNVECVICGTEIFTDKTGISNYTVGEEGCELIFGVIKVKYRSYFHSWVLNVPNVSKTIVKAFEVLSTDNFPVVT